MRENASVYKIIAIVFTLFALGGAGYAQLPSGNVFVGYSFGWRSASGAAVSALF